MLPGQRPVMEVVCAAPVAAGEELTIAYTDVHAPSWRRQAALHQSRQFRCVRRDPAQPGHFTEGRAYAGRVFRRLLKLTAAKS